MPLGEMFANVTSRLPIESLPSHYTSFQVGATPLSTLPVVLAVLIGYVALVFSIREVMRDRPPIKLNSLFRAHNAVLTAGSAFLLALVAGEGLSIVWNHGIFYGLCAFDALTPKMEFYYIINYYFKYFELIDTVFLALRKKPLTFLHVFHHSATAFLCWVCLEGRVSGIWIAIMLNLAVHVVMYYYYYAAASGQKIWWKRYLTQMQISQFVVDVGFTYYAIAYMILVRFPALEPIVAALYPALPNGQKTCAGSNRAAAFGSGIASSYLFLFLDFYIRTYKKSTAGSVRGKRE
ncbi:hypothetical protein BOTBODRAFT_29199 [Botryobasidium botryosum FD-172 SS1]|uniref:Elongation of fatty acids protein n=1 Tax=Botryobasidium botryosum (strain FD-172 SS1) TaxID=930990 RepID=A0A067MQQ7_BOTB1|nr:hypothetical protein BOTBODRAFT_29199 [Botryobasidium botryosum FD-172 SS1]